VSAPALTPERYDAIIIGSGQAGTPLSTALAESGRRTALVERKHVGGTCINEGCTPTKTMAASARVAYLARRASDYGVHAEDVRVDMQRVRRRKREIVESFRGANGAKIKRTAKLDLLAGEAAFTGPKSVRVTLADGGERLLTGEMIFINAGDRPSVPPIDGLRDTPFLDSTSIMELDAVPEHLIVLGGGDAGLEFAQMFRRFGSRVTIVEVATQLLAREDPDIAQEVAALLQQDGIDLRLGAKVSRIAQAGSGIRVMTRIGGVDADLDGSHLLVTTGRTPNSDSLNLPAAGVATDEHGFIRVNDKLETSQPGVFALGDIKGGPAFTHISYDDFRIVRTNVIEQGNASVDGRMVPYTVFIDPQLGRIGVSEAEARAQGRNIRVAKLPMTSVARAVEVDETRGFMKAIVDAETGRILGAAVLGVAGGEVMAMLQLAMMGNLHYAVLRDGIFAHPTLAESLNNLFARLG
jgi:pyruvate/2-oxoglutarate dehydrogenase complex dihydrolipoamide dehydrogenase (E3) component